MSGPRIVRIELTPVHVPFREAVRDVMGSGAGGVGMAIPVEHPWLGGDFVICRLCTDDGFAGVSEAFVWLPETGVSPGEIVACIRDGLGKYVLGGCPFDVEHIRWRMDNNVARCEVAKGLLDAACYDLMGRITGRPACDLMGGRTVDKVPLAALVPLVDPEAMTGICAAFHEQGFRTFRIKLGRSIEQDVAIISRIRERLGSAIRLRVDYNQAYSPAEAMRAIRAIEPYGIDYAEQPVRATDSIGMASVQKHVTTPLMAHEGCFSLHDIVTLVEIDAIRVVGLNAERPGGVTNALRAIAYAELRGLGVAIHNQSLGIGAAMQLHLAAAKHHSLGHATELFGHVMFEDDLVVQPLDYSGGTGAVPSGPGWGVELDEETLVKYATGPTLTIEAS